MSLTPITHVIFDLDGTIVDWNTPTSMVLNDYANSVGKSISPDKLADILSLESTEMFPVFLKELDLYESIDNKTFIKQMMAKILSQKWPLIPGVDKLVQHLHRHRIPMAIATNSPNTFYEAVTKKFGNYFDSYFSHYVCAATDPEVKHHKPDPEVYVICKNRFPTAPVSMDSVLIIEDSLSGIKGAVASGAKTLLINNGNRVDFSSIAHQITVLSKCFDDFKPESIGLPPY